MAAGKARGQEAVWRAQCKPTWWNEKCPGLVWKNPTANPKDSKDTLKIKFECLVEHLKQQNSIPGELEEEIQLWEAGRISEVFLMTTFSSMLGQVSGLHSVLNDAYRKMADIGTGINGCIPSDIEKCLTECLSKICSIKKLAENRKTDSGDDQQVPKDAKRSALKRDLQDPGTEGSAPPAKQARVASPTISSSSSSSRSTPQTVSPVSSMDSDPNNFLQNGNNTFHGIGKQALVLALLQQKIVQNKMEGAAVVQQGPQLSAQRRQRVVPASVQARPTRRGKLVKQSGSVTSAVSAAPSVLATASGSVAGAVTVHHPTLIPGNHLDIDFLEETTIEDCEFLDKLLAENSALVDDQVTESNLAIKTPSVSAAIGEESTIQTNSTTSDLVLPLISDTTLLASENSNENSSPCASPLTPSVMAPSESCSLEDYNVSLDNIGTDVDVVVGGGVVFDDQDFSDAGYSSESSLSHRNSTDSIDDHFEVDNLDFDTLLNSLEFENLVP